MEIWDRDLLTRIPFKRKFMYIYGGFAIECDNGCEDMWRFEIPYGSQRYYPQAEFGYWNRGGHWEEVYQGYSPGKRYGHAMVTDPEYNYIYLFGGLRGYDQNIDPDPNRERESEYLKDLWRYNMEYKTWEMIITLGISSVRRNVVTWNGGTIGLNIVPTLR